MLLTAQIALLLVAPMAAILFSLLRPHHAAAIVMFGAMLFLPERVGFDLPGLPSIDKGSLPSIAVLIALFLTAPHRLALAHLLRRSDWFLVVLVLGAFATGYSNSDPVPCGSLAIRGIGAWDALSDASSILLGIVAPYLVGRAQIRSSRELRDFAAILVGASLVYLPLIYFELRMSPQLHNMVYGFSQHSFGQTIRFGGYRPMVFMSHGLTLAMFSLAGVVAAWALTRRALRTFGALSVPIALVLSVTHVLLKSTGAILYALAALPLVFLVKRRTGFIVTALLCAIVLTYPSTRAAGTFPTTWMVEQAQALSYERAQSLEFRFQNEDILLEKARQRFWLGWSGWGRSRVYDADGRDISVTDGTWVIVFGTYGAFGFYALFGLLTNASLTAFRALRHLRPTEAHLLSALTWVQVLLVVDLIPNSIGSNLHLYLTGCIVGAAHSLVKENRSSATVRGRDGGLRAPPPILEVAGHHRPRS